MSRRNAIPRTERQAQAKERALAVLARMRREELKFWPAMEAVGTSRNTVWRYAGSALRQEHPGGRIRVTEYDRISRTLNFITPEGKFTGKVQDSRMASALAEHLNAVKVFANTGDLSALKKFEGRTFRASGQIYQYVTDRETLAKLADAGELGAFERLYVAVKEMMA